MGASATIVLISAGAALLLASLWKLQPAPSWPVPTPIGSREVPRPRILISTQPRVVSPYPLWTRSYSTMSPGASSYNASEVLGDVQQEILRLKTQLDLFFAKELRSMRWYLHDSCARRAGPVDELLMVELGGGPGFSTLRFAEAMPHATIVSVELEPAFVEAARRLIAKRPKLRSRVRVIEGSVPQSA